MSSPCRSYAPDSTLYTHFLWFRLLTSFPFCQAGLLQKFPVFFHNQISFLSYQQISFKKHSSLVGSLPFHSSFSEETVSLFHEKATVHCPEVEHQLYSLPFSFPTDLDLSILWLLHLNLAILVFVLVHSTRVISKCQHDIKIWRVLIVIVKQMSMCF